MVEFVSSKQLNNLTADNPSWIIVIAYIVHARQDDSILLSYIHPDL